MSRSALAVAALLAVSGCATIDIYRYTPRALPPGSQALSVVSWSLQDLRNISWSSGGYHPERARTANVGADLNGVAAITTWPNVSAAPLYVTYGEIAEGVAAVTQSEGLWTVVVRDHYRREIEMQFNSYYAARLFLDAASALAAAQQQVAQVEDP